MWLCADADAQGLQLLRECIIHTWIQQCPDKILIRMMNLKYPCLWFSDKLIGTCYRLNTWLWVKDTLV